MIMVNKFYNLIFLICLVLGVISCVLFVDLNLSVEIEKVIVLEFYFDLL